MTLKDEDIQYASSSICDPLGRVFFYNNRIFRAIREEYKDHVLNFLTSECYHELDSKGWIVSTHVCDDVQLIGYALVLEHERLICDVWKYWSFEQLRDAALFLFELDDLLQNYGYFLKDASFENLTIKNNHFCLMDFGSVGGENHPNVFMDLIPKCFLHLNLLSHREFLLADVLPYSLSIIVPNQHKINIRAYYKYLRPVISKIQIYYRYRYKPLSLHTSLVIRLIEGIMWMANVSEKSREIIYNHIKIQFDKQKIRKEIKRMHPPYNENAPIYDTEYISDEQCSKLHGERLLIYGNFAFECLEMIEKKLPSTQIYIGSSDRIYIDNAYQYFKGKPQHVEPILFDILKIDDLRDNELFHVDEMLIGRQLYEACQRLGIPHSSICYKINTFFREVLIIK